MCNAEFWKWTVTGNRQSHGEKRTTENSPRVKVFEQQQRQKQGGDDDRNTSMATVAYLHEHTVAYLHEHQNKNKTHTMYFYHRIIQLSIPT